MRPQTIGVVGLGKVGLPLALVMAKYFDVKGADINSVIIGRIKKRGTFFEPNVSEYLEKYGHHMEVSTDFEIIAPCSVIFVCVQTPSTPDGMFDLKHVLSATSKLSKYLRRKSQILVVASTINPTDMDERIIPFLKKLGVLERIKDVCYNPAMIALGNTIHGFEHPDYVLIGESNKQAGKRLEDVWKKIVPDNTPIIHGSIVDIEAAKFTLNLALVNKISFINTATEFCEGVGADVDFIADILRLEPRIAGKKMFRGGLGFGGTCFPRDVVAFKTVSEKFGVSSYLCDAIQQVNKEQILRSVKLIDGFHRKRVGILGITYKPNTSLTVESQGLQIAHILQRKRYEVTIYDPSGMESAKRRLKGVKFADSMKQCVRNSETVFLAVPWSEFSKLKAKDFRRDQIVIDPWRVLRDKELPCRYIAYGLKWR